MGRVEQTIEFVCREFGGDLRLITQHRSQMTLFGHGPLAAVLEQMVRGIAAQALRQHNADGFGQHQALGQVQVAAHARGIDFQPFDQCQGLLQRPGHQAADFRQGFPLGMPQAQATLVLLGHGAEHGRQQARHPGCSADQHSRAHRVALVRHGRRPALARRRRFEYFRSFGLHQQADIAAKLAQATGHQTQY
ncbi:hypothetical protein D3C76_917860 [compost metagenome]